MGTAASWSADLTLVIELVMGLALGAGALLAKKRRYRAHAWCQSTVVLLNLSIIAGYMVPRFRRQIFAALPGGFGDSHYLLAVLHAALGASAELFAVYVLLAAGTGFLPRRMRFTHFVPWMRSALILWWLALVLGLSVYIYWYIAPLYQ